MKRKNEKQKPARRARKSTQPIVETESENEIVAAESAGNDGRDSDTIAETSPEETAPKENQIEEALSNAKNDLLDVENLLSNFSKKQPTDTAPPAQENESADGKRKYSPRKKKGDEPERAPVLIPGKLFVSVCDNIVVGAIGIIDGYMYPKLRLDTRFLKLTDEQRNELAPLAEEALRMMPFIDDPRIAFFGSLIASHALNYVNLRNTLAAEMRAARQQAQQ